MIGICYLCEEEKNLSRTYKKNKICGNCYDKYFRMSQECDVCHEYGIIKSSKSGIKICEECYRALYRKYTNNYPLHICCKCGEEKPAAKITEDGHICWKCYERPKQICSICNKEKIVNAYIYNQPVCKTCYICPESICSICGSIGPTKSHIDGKPIGDCCYKRPVGKCDCGSVSVLTKGKCASCYEKERKENDEEFYIKKLIKSRLSHALKLYSKTGKIKHTDEYGINYQAIIEHLGPCPGNRKDYHIDHFFPLIAFDFNNLMHIRAAFAPENHQWLTAKENLSKNDSYDETAFQAYLVKFGV